jgi:hypothetical protein
MLNIIFQLTPKGPLLQRVGSQDVNFYLYCGFLNSFGDAEMY